MNNSTAIYHHEVVDSSYVPRLYSRETHERFAYIAETTYSILSKVMREYLENPSYRHVYDIDPRLVELICCRAATTRCCRLRAWTCS